MSSATDYFDALRTGLTDAADAWEEAARFWEESARQWAEPPSTGTGRRWQRDRCHEHSARGQADCGCCGDACRCCVPEADVVLHTRVGETRVIPFRVANTWRRPREVTLAVGQWQLCEGEPVTVRAVFDVDERLTLEPCSERVVRLVVRAGGDRELDPQEAGRQEAFPDVGSCTSLYADLRFEGCSRPQRVAVVLHPASCVAIDLDCSCGCCG